MGVDIRQWQKADRLIFLRIDEARFALPALFSTGNCFRRAKRSKRGDTARYEYAVGDAGGMMRLYFDGNNFLRFDLYGDGHAVKNWLPFRHYLDSEIELSVVTMLKECFPSMSMKTRIKIAGLFHDFSLAYSALGGARGGASSEGYQESDFGLIAC